MKKLSTGDDSTLGNYRKLTVLVFGENNKAVEYLDELIAKSPKGENEEVLADENQMVHVLGRMILNK